MFGFRRREMKCSREIDPSVVAAAQVEATLTDLRASLKAGEPQRDAQRIVARRARERAAELLERNHFGESIECAMRRRA